HKGIWAYEALVRGPEGEPAYTILEQVSDANRYRFDQVIRARAISLASDLGMEAMLSINFLPNAVYKAETCIRATIEAAEETDFPLEQIMFEVTEVEELDDYDHLVDIIDTYQQLGFMTAIDDFGSGYSGLNMFADFQPDLVKLDMDLVRDIDSDEPRTAIVRGIVDTCRELDVGIMAEGVETEAELSTLLDLGVRRFQGYYFAKPAFEALPAVDSSLLSATG
ncbi:MAG: EAL domain-containing protein, partial [Phycisphaeraceae bacterium]|nr:EAL domain-containing protein [Phycisphaeraceae bacterium]